MDLYKIYRTWSDASATLARLKKNAWIKEVRPGEPAIVQDRMDMYRSELNEMHRTWANCVQPQPQHEREIYEREVKGCESSIRANAS